MYLYIIERENFDVKHLLLSQMCPQKLKRFKNVQVILNIWKGPVSVSRYISPAKTHFLIAVDLTYISNYINLRI